MDSTMLIGLSHFDYGEWQIARQNCPW
jgi:hypothetical protein